MLLQSTQGLRHPAAVVTTAAAATLLCTSPVSAEMPPDPSPDPRVEPMEPMFPPILPGREPAGRLRGAVEPVVDVDAVEAEREWFGHASWMTWERMTGDWGGVRSELEHHGISFNGASVIEWARTSGGIDDRWAFRQLLDLNVELDLATMVDLEGGTVFAAFQNATEPVGQPWSGSYQVTSNIAIDGRIGQLSEIWYQQLLFDDSVRVKLGKVDANSEFAYITSAGEFINASAGFTPTIFAMPTYPDPAFSANVFWTPTESIYAGFGVYDGALAADGISTGGLGPGTAFSADDSDDVFLITEGGIRFKELGPLTGALLGVGGWWHSGEFDTFSGGTRRGAGGVYALGEARLWTPANVDLDDPEDLGGLWAFGQFGWAPDDVAEVGMQLGGGLSLFGTFADRPDDSVGIYVTWADFSDDAGSPFVGDETVVEAYYDIAVTPWFHVKPDIQHVSNPSGDPTLRDAWVATLRLTFVF